MDKETENGLRCEIHRLIGVINRMGKCMSYTVHASRVIQADEARAQIECPKCGFNVDIELYRVRNSTLICEFCPATSMKIISISMCKVKKGQNKET